MAANTQANPAHPSEAIPMLARRTDHHHIVIFNGANLPTGEWFEVARADGKIVLTPVSTVPAAAIAWAQQQDAQAAAAKPRPYQHLTVDELREVNLTPEERLAELRARGIISRAAGPWRPFEPVARVPGALERFLKERREQG